MYAIEEYGKAHLVKGCFVEAKKVYSVPKWIFGGKGRPHSGNTSHIEKLSEGFKHLPHVCLKLSNVVEIVHNASP